VILTHQPPAFRTQTGIAASGLILIIFLASVSAATIYYYSGTLQRLESDRQTAAALAQARDALIGFATAVDTAGAPGPRPGDLPCPSTALLADGTPSGIATTPCNNLAIGYLPWRTLGLPPLRDGSGELLWYAVSAGFKNNPRSAAPLNSDTAGEFTITGTTAATEVIAIIFAPGATLGSQGQNRTPLQNDLCATTGTVIPRVRCAANYLEGENADGNTLFSSSPATHIPDASNQAFNDRLMFITRETFFPAVENRVARDIRSALSDYYATNNYYPYAANLTGATTCVSGNYPSGNFRGRLPVGGCTDLAPLTLPTWVTGNRWEDVLVYAVAPRCTPRINSNMFISNIPVVGAICSVFFPPLIPFLCTQVTLSGLGCSNTANGAPFLTVDSSSGVHALVFTAGARRAGQNSPRIVITDYLEAVGGNNENIDTPDDHIYTQPSRSALNNDGLTRLP
jgi:type II secretory pathway pseudopilin PulG